MRTCTSHKSTSSMKVVSRLAARRSAMIFVLLGGVLLLAASVQAAETWIDISTPADREAQEPGRKAGVAGRLFGRRR